MALTPASILADYTSGIGTQGATLKVNTSDKRIGIGTTNPQGTLQVGTGITMGSGIVTATSFDANTASFSGNVSVGGVLTYEDVTNVDSVGVITARNGIRVGAGQSIGSDGALTYYGNGFNLTGIDATAIKDSAGGTVRVQANTSGAVVTGILTVTTGAVVTGILTATTLEQTQTYPTIRPTLDLNFAATKTLDRRITFTRDGVGTYTDHMGIIRYASNNVPRFDHDPTTGESLGLLIEEARTNVLYGTPSQSNTINSYNQYNSLTGEYDATKLAKNSPSSSQSHGSWNWNGNVSTSSFVMSIFVKKVNHASFFIQMISSGVGDNLYVYFNIDTKVTSIVDNASPGNLTVTRSIENYGDGWFRLVARVEGFSNTALHSGIAFGFASGGSDTQGYQDTSDEVLIYGAQAEVGNFVTSYIPTHESTTSVTRGSDQAKITGTNFTDFYNQEEGTVFSSHQQYSGLSDTQNTYVYQIANNNSASVAFRLIDKNSFYSSPARLSATQWANDVLMQKPDATNGERIKTAFTCKVNDAAVSYDGATVLTDNSLDMNSGQTNMSIGMYPTTPQGFLNGHVQQISYYNKRLPNDQLQGLTA